LKSPRSHLEAALETHDRSGCGDAAATDDDSKAPEELPSIQKSPWHSPRRSQLESRIALGAVLVALLASRWMTHADYLLHLDAGCFARALTQFDLSALSPHPPGYVLFVLLGRLARLIANDANHAYLIVNVATQVGTVLILFRLLRASLDTLSTTLAVAIVIFHPLFWYYGTTTSIYATEVFLAVAIIGALDDDHRHPSSRCLGFLGFLWTFVGGIRPTTVLFLGPVFLDHLWHRRRDGRGVLLALMMSIVGATMWVVPLMIMSGGSSAYVDATGEYFDHFLTASSIFFADDASVALKYGMVTGLAFALLLMPLAPMVIAGYRRRRVLAIDSGVASSRFLLLWSLPALGFFLLLHMGQHGYALWFLAPLVIYLVTRSALASTRAQSPWACRWPLLATLVLEFGWYLGAPALVKNYPKMADASFLNDRANWKYLLGKAYRIQSDFSLNGVRLWENITRGYLEALLQYAPDSVLFIEHSYRETNAWLLVEHAPEYTFLARRMKTAEWAILGGQLEGLVVEAEDGETRLYVPSPVRAVLLMDEGFGAVWPRRVESPRLTQCGKSLYLFSRGDTVELPDLHLILGDIHFTAPSMLNAGPQDQ